MEPLRAIGRGLAAAERVAVEALMIVGVAIMPIMALAITFEVVVRYFFRAPTTWVVDASAFGLLWVAFLTAPWLIRHNGHIRIEFLTAKLPPWGQALAATLTSLAGAAIMVVVFWQTTNETVQAYLRNVHTIGSWEIPRFLVWMVMPVGSLFAILEFLRAAWLDSAPLRGERGGRTTPIDAAVAPTQVT